ncbi:gliding motility-associated C-terminal domain-containing protein [Cytophaga aurantiaca]|uniref:T9SS type B sorting domain-containing protein n=1 Tax=Cytophaga aurantiaca TaxID=29530 RepID=UPI00037C9E4C|nr:gliding motility-associated C-terminal domain-containing protein [Cytophaga aurantiaca]
MDIFNKIRKFTYVVILALFFSQTSYATHIKAGEFSARRISNTALQYEIILTLYYNSLSPAAGSPGGDDVSIDFGDGTQQTVTRDPPIDVGNNTSKNIFRVNHTYNGSSTYLIGMREVNRNANIWNIPGSSDKAFYVEMELKISPLYGLNSSPVMTVPPIDFGAVGKIFTHNPGAYDPDGDSLSYELIAAQSGVNQPIVGYNLPSSPIFGGTSTLGGPAFLTLDPVTGDIVWNTPNKYQTAPWYYNIVIKITEWRYGRPIGYIVRDMQVEIKETINNPPVLAMPKDTCIEAGSLLHATIKASDPDGDVVRLESYGQPYQVPSSPATITYTGQSTKTPSGNFNWQTNCTHVRNQPYQAVFKATDQNQVPLLVDIQTWLISVKGPRIKGITATPGLNSVTLNWPLYTCSAKAEFIKIYRRDCDSVAPNLDPCKTGVLPGYTLVGTVAATATTFLDNNNGIGLNKGKTYCYILVATYPAPGYGESYPSAQVCVQLNRDVAVFSSVDVTETSTTTGKVFLSWYKPSASFIAGPYTYDVERGVGLAPALYTTVATAVTDTFYTDINLDTKNTIYSYRIKLVNNGLYSTVVPVFDLTTVAGNASANLSWTYKTPWITDSVEVYRKINSTGTFSKLVKLAPTAVSYKDNTVANCDTVYYYIKQYGRYCDKELLQIATQTSAIDSVRPMNDNPPVAPALSVRGCDGDLTIFQNVLNWTDLVDEKCNTIDHYNVYFATHNTDQLNKIFTTTDTTYTYINHQTTAGCYQVSATNLAGVEGARSTKICVDDCIYYELPNLLTVNNDGQNDLVKPFPVPRGACFVRYYVYNRWGSLVYYKDTDPNVNWDGKVEKGELSDGVYYFLAEVHFCGRVNQKDEVKNIKGWLQILTTK